MLKILKFFSKKRATTSQSASVRVVLDSARLCQLLPYFPIGANLRYFPEYRQEITLDSIIIAYLINDEVIYSNNDLSTTDDNHHLILNGAMVDEINNFAFLIPAVSRNETELDYEQKEILEQSGGLAKGNSITLIGQQTDGKIPFIDTLVTKHTRFKEGHFNNTQVVALNVDPTLLELKDQRSQTRLAAKIPALIQTKLYNEKHQCTLIDFSEHTVKICCDDNEIISISCTKGEIITLTFNLPSSTTPKVMKGRVLKIDGPALIAELEEILVDQRFKKLTTLDILEIKTKLLQQPLTSTNTT
ncbi:MAG: PilZ domain-containing protein [Gammaproteobacteria bacterium]|nr:PilZ domain-containing protein [Gammaproteobacteria bacterium]